MTIPQRERRYQSTITNQQRHYDESHHPGDIAKTKLSVIPEIVFTVFNQEIARTFDGGDATVKQDRVVDALVEAGLNRSEIFENGWLNIEPCYEEAGWKVTYTKPAYNETGSAVFIFEAGR